MRITLHVELPHVCVTAITLYGVAELRIYKKEKSTL